MISAQPKVECYVLHCASPKGDELLKETLDSLWEQDYEDLEVKVIENGCTVDWLDPGERIHLSTNLGISIGYNVGLGAGSSPYVLLINNDIRASKEMVSHLVATAEAGLTTGIVCPRIFYYPTRKIWYDGGLFNKWTGVSRHRNIRKIGPADSKAKATEWATGCCMLIKREVIESVGLFDEAYSPAYSEDIDYSIRARCAGWRIMVDPKAWLWHKVSSSIKILEG